MTTRSRPAHTSIRLLRLGGTLLALLAVPATSAAQSLTGTSASPIPGSANGVEQEGEYLTAPVTLDGALLFRIAAPVNPEPGQIPIVTRQTAVENALQQVVQIAGSGSKLAPLYDPKTLKVDRTVSDGQVVLEVTDATHPTPLPIVTVTPVDAKFNGETITTVADAWQPALQSALRTALDLREPSVQEQNVQKVAIGAVVLAFATLGLWFGAIRPLRRRAAEIDRRLADPGSGDAQGSQTAAAADPNAPHAARRRSLAIALHETNPKRELAIVRAVASTLVWLGLAVWLGGAVWAFLLFPQTTLYAHEALRTSFAVAATWIATGLISRALDVSIARIGTLYRGRRARSAEERARELLRVPTAVAAISGAKTFVLVFIALLLTLGEIGIPIWSVVTFGGLAAIGISLAAQNFLRDFVNGFLVLLEDQYVVGDYVTINNFSGVVENLTLRIAQLRDSAGNFITIPHSSVTVVVNQSRNWSRIDYKVPIDAAADAEKAIEAIGKAVADISKEEPWSDAVLGPVEWIGVDAISRDGIVIRAAIKTAPLRQFEVRRALNERVREALMAAGIALGAPVADTPP